ncbi:diguanylate cyclase domain-containing protein [Roseibium marinum]|uniref:Diguanylate cyclase (GGDEF)-like protein n=1 Tax=Roseibium marinum TaxID=281252 RepID=A0A2S3UMD9_9HYPH|nr:diguanylate cyclase [Roseibium marinum]POF28864.1 diguanylate cyclase (GGDEF)-like protein [Roseibium marinum]
MTEFRRRYSDQTASVARQHISRLAFLLAGLLIAVTSASLLFVGFIASQASTEQAIANEKRLFRNTLAHRMRALVREQITVTSSDKSVAGLVLNFDADYAYKVIDTLWSDYRHSKVMVISGNGDVLAETFEHYTHILKRPIAEAPELEALFGKIKSLFEKNRVRVPGGYGHRSLQGMDPEEYALMGFTRIDGKPAMFGVMPVIPDDYENVLPDGPPTVVLSAHYIDETLLGQVNAQLNFASLKFVEEAPAGSAAFHAISNPDGETIGLFTWDSQTVGNAIWPTIIPVILLLSVALAALAFGIAWRIGQLTSSLQASEQQNRHLALHDTLTGLANRLQFNRVLATSVTSLPGKPFVIIQCDLDKFKAVNDTFGHAAGDLVIKTMAGRLKKVIGHEGLVSRVGGDEFMIIYRKATDRASLHSLCTALVETAKAPIEIRDEGVAHIGLSVGIAVAPDDGTTAESLIARSDAALYRSKNLGRNRYSLFSDFFDSNSDPNEPPLSLEDPRPYARAGKAR